MSRLAALLLILLAAFAVNGGRTPQPARGAPGRPGDSKLSSRLSELTDLDVTGSLAPSLAQQNAQVSLGAGGAGSLMRDSQGRLVVDVRVRDTSQGTLAALGRHDAQVLHVSTDYHTVTAAVDIATLNSLAAEPNVEYVEEVLRPIVWSRPLDDGTAPRPTAAGCNPIITEGDVQLNAATARTAFGVDGTGVTIGVLSDSYDRWAAAPKHPADDIASGDLPGPGNPCGHPTPVTVLDDGAPDPDAELRDEGRAMIQTIHDLAPGANLKFATAFTSSTSFASNILALQAAGAKVIVDDVAYFDEPFFQDGPIAVAANTARANGAVMVTAAGNNAEVPGNGYAATSFSPAGTCPASINSIEGQTVTCHNFGVAKPDMSYGFVLANNATARVDMQWAESWFGVGTDLDLFLVDNASNAVLAKSTSNNSLSQKPFEFLSYKNTSGATQTLALMVAKYSGGIPAFKIIFMTNGAGGIGLEYSTLGGSQVFGHNGAESEISLGATRYDDGTTIEKFSSQGPVATYFPPVSGTTPQPYWGQHPSGKPDVTATDGVANTFFGPLSAGTYRFFGTSNAAPHAAAIAALVLNYKPSASPPDVMSSLRFTSRPIAGGGNGLVSAVRALGVFAPPTTFTSPSSVTFTEGVASSFTITTQAFQPPLIKIDAALPSGLTLTDNHNGTATLAGAPVVPEAGHYRVLMDATTIVNSVSQQLTINVVAPTGYVPILTNPKVVDTVSYLAYSVTIVSTGGTSTNPEISDAGVVLSEVSVNANPTLGAPGVLHFQSLMPANVGTLNTFIPPPVPGTETIKPAVTYAWRAYAINSTGISYSDTGTFFKCMVLGVSSQPVTVIESPAPGSNSASFPVTGWAIDKGQKQCSGVDNVHIYIYPADAAGNASGPQVFFAAANYAGARQDVAQTQGANFLNSGFSTQPVPALPAGKYVITVYAHSMISGNWNPTSRVITVLGPQTNPLMTIDQPIPGNVPGSFAVSGWTIDKGSPTGTGTGIDQVHVYVYPADANGNVTGAQVFFAAATPGARSDIKGLFGPQFENSGFSTQTSVLPAGNYVVTVYAHSTVSNAWNSLSRKVTIQGPLMNVDYPGPGDQVPATFPVNGWAIDRASSSGSGVDMVHVYVYPANASGGTTGPQVFFAAATLGVARPDIAGLYGAQFASSGFSAQPTNLPNGFYNIAVYMHSSLNNGWVSQTRFVGVGMKPATSVTAAANSSSLGEVPVPAQPGVPPLKAPAGPPVADLPPAQSLPALPPTKSR